MALSLIFCRFYLLLVLLFSSIGVSYEESSQCDGWKQCSNSHRPSDFKSIQQSHASMQSIDALYNEVKDALERSFQEQDSLGTSKRPVVTLSYAQTIDGSIAPADRSRWELSSNSSFRLLHSLRHLHEGILIGINTLKYDLPKLNVRTPMLQDHLDRQPRPIVIDTELKILDVDQVHLNQPIIFTCCDCPHEKMNLATEKVKANGGVIIKCKRDTSNGLCDLNDCLAILQQQFHIKSVLLEGGAAMIQSFLEHRLVDNVVVTIKPWYYGGFRAMKSQLKRPVQLKERIMALSEDDIILFGKVSV